MIQVAYRPAVPDPGNHSLGPAAPLRRDPPMEWGWGLGSARWGFGPRRAFAAGPTVDGGDSPHAHATTVRVPARLSRRDPLGGLRGESPPNWGVTGGHPPGEIQCVSVPKVTVSPAQEKFCHLASLPVVVSATMSFPPS